MTQESPIPAVTMPKMANSLIAFQTLFSLHSEIKYNKKTAANGNAITAQFNLVIMPKPRDSAIFNRFFKDLYQNADILKEDIEDIKKAKDYIIHVHMARPDPERKYPTEAEIEPCRVWAETLHSIGYDGRLSLECSFKDEFDIGLTKVKCVTDMFKYRG